MPKKHKNARPNTNKPTAHAVRHAVPSRKPKRKAFKPAPAPTRVAVPSSVGSKPVEPFSAVPYLGKCSTVSTTLWIPDLKSAGENSVIYALRLNMVDVLATVARYQATASQFVPTVVRSIEGLLHTTVRFSGILSGASAKFALVFVPPAQIPLITSTEALVRFFESNKKNSVLVKIFNLAKGSTELKLTPLPGMRPVFPANISQIAQDTTLSPTGLFINNGNVYLLQVTPMQALPVTGASTAAPVYTDAVGLNIGALTVKYTFSGCGVIDPPSTALPISFTTPAQITAASNTIRTQGDDFVRAAVLEMTPVDELSVPGSIVVTTRHWDYEDAALQNLDISVLLSAAVNVLTAFAPSLAPFIESTLPFLELAISSIGTFFGTRTFNERINTELNVAGNIGSSGLPQAGPSIFSNFVTAFGPSVDRNNNPRTLLAAILAKADSISGAPTTVGERLALLVRDLFDAGIYINPLSIVTPATFVTTGSSERFTAMLDPITDLPSAVPLITTAPTTSHDVLGYLLLCPSVQLAGTTLPWDVTAGAALPRAVFASGISGLLEEFDLTTQPAGMDVLESVTGWIRKIGFIDADDASFTLSPSTVYVGDWVSFPWIRVDVPNRASVSYLEYIGTQHSFIGASAIDMVKSGFLPRLHLQQEYNTGSSAYSVHVLIPDSRCRSEIQAMAKPPSPADLTYIFSAVHS